MPEEQAFCVLLKLMYEYGLRDLYKDGFENLYMRLYQLDKLMEVCIEIIKLFQISMKFLISHHWLVWRRLLL